MGEKGDAVDPLEGGRLLLGELNCASCHDRASPRCRRNRPRCSTASAAASSAATCASSSPTRTRPSPARPCRTCSPALPEASGRNRSRPWSTSSPRPARRTRSGPDRKLVAPGRDLYHKVGCVACHGTRDAVRQTRQDAAHVGPARPKAKYTLGSLRAFLENPHGAPPCRPHAEPAQRQGSAGGRQLPAAGRHAGRRSPDNMSFAYYEGDWDKLPDFDEAQAGHDRGRRATSTLASPAAMRTWPSSSRASSRSTKDGAVHVLPHQRRRQQALDRRQAGRRQRRHPRAATVSRRRVRSTKGMHKLDGGGLQRGRRRRAGRRHLEGRGLGKQTSRRSCSSRQDGDTSRPRRKRIRKKTTTLRRCKPELVDEGPRAVRLARLRELPPAEARRQAARWPRRRRRSRSCRPAAAASTRRPSKASPWFALSAAQRTALGGRHQAPRAGHGQRRRAEVDRPDDDHVQLLRLPRARQGRRRRGGAEQARSRRRSRRWATRAACRRRSTASAPS